MSSLLYTDPHESGTHHQKLEKLKSSKRKALVDAEEEDNIRRKKIRDAETKATIERHNVG